MITLSTLRAARSGLAAFAAMGIVWGTFAATLPDIITMLGVSESRMGLLLVMTPVAAVTAMLLAPRIGAALGPVALPVATACMALAFMLPGQTSGLVLFPLAMMACGAATGLTDVLMTARVSALENQRGLHLMNLTHAAYSFGYAAGAIATGLMRNAAWPPASVLGTMALFAFALALVTIERDGIIPGLVRPKGSTTTLGWLPVIGGGMVLIAFLTENAAENWSALHIEKTLGGTPAQGAMGPAALALTMGFARLVGQSLASRIDPLTLLRAGAVVSAAGALIAAMATSPAMAYAGFIVMGIGASVIAPTAFSLVGRLAPADTRTRAVARATLYGYCGYFVGPPLLGFIAGTFGLRAAFVFTAACLALIIALVAVMARQTTRTAPSVPD